jgi:hypothetical protein
MTDATWVRDITSNGGAWTKIDLGVSKVVRSLYLALPESNGVENLQNLRIHIGDVGTWNDDPLCWQASHTE